jgi:hypothetical protein
MTNVEAPQGQGMDDYSDKEDDDVGDNDDDDTEVGWWRRGRLVK